MTAIRKRLREFIAIAVLILIAAVVGGYILSQQRLTLPGWVPIVGSDVFVLKAQFSTAQAVTPGQGQTVNIAGVNVGEITQVDLVDGRAVVTMEMEPKYATVYPDAAMLLRPKTGLKDMLIELDPGTPKSGPKLKQNDTVPIQNTLPDVNADEILAALDGDTRSYLKLLLGGAGEGLRNRQADLSQTLRRFEPTARDLDLITSQLKERRSNIRRGIHNFQLLATALGDKDQDLGDLVDSSNAVFQAFSNQDQRIRETLQLLPPTLQTTQTNLTKVEELAQLLGPTTQALRPGARALGPSLEETRPFLRESTPIIRDQLRPFTQEALPTIKVLRPTAQNLVRLTPDLSSAFDTLNYTLNTLTYNPPGKEDEGYFFWLSWANQVGATIFNAQDAHGPIRRGLLLIGCQSAGVLQSVAAVNPALKTLVDLTNAPTQSAICPGQAGAPGGGTGGGGGQGNPGGLPTVPGTPSLPGGVPGVPLPGASPLKAEKP